MMHLCMTTNTVDDLWFAKILDKMTLTEYWAMRYQTWSSRLIIETLLIMFVKVAPIFWKLADSLVSVVLAYAIVTLFLKKKSSTSTWLVVALIMIYPFNQMTSAGWIATTMNYFWPLAFGLFAMIPIRRYLDQEPVHPVEQALVFLAMLYGCNTEQMGAIIFCVYGIFILYGVCIKKHFSKALILNFALAVASFIFIITCPGNGQRKISELHWFPGFENLSVIQKAAMGFLTSTSELFYVENKVYFVFICVLLVAVWMTHKKWTVRVLGALPLLYYLFSVKALQIIFKLFPSLEIYTPTQYIGEISSFDNLTFYLYCVINLCVLLLVFLDVFLALNKTKVFPIAVLTLGAGIASRVIIGFSPTIFISGDRTAIFLTFSFIIVSALLAVYVCFKRVKPENCRYLIYILLT